MKELKTERKRTTVAVIAEQHFLAPIILVAHLAGELRQKLSDGSKQRTLMKSLRMHTSDESTSSSFMVSATAVRLAALLLPAETKAPGKLAAI
jgi:hypothetical protein